MKPRTLLILLLLVGGLSAFIWFWERTQPSTEKRAELAKKVVPFAAQEVIAVTLEHDGQKVRLERDPLPADKSAAGDTAGLETLPPPRDWRLAAPPFGGRADRSAADRLVDSLVGLEKERTLAGVPAADVGLDKPRLKVTLTTAGGDTVLAVGAPVPASVNTALSVAGATDPFIVPGSFVQDAMKPAGDWRTRDLFTGQREAIERLALQPAAGEKVLLGKRGEELWLEAPVADRADRDAANGLVSDVVALRAESFVDMPPVGADLGLAPPRGAIEAVVKDQKAPFRVEIGAPVAGQTGRVYARVGAQTVEIGDRLAQALAKGAAGWRSTGWTSFEVYRIDAAKVEEPTGKVELARDGADWKRGSEKISYSPVSDFLYALSTAKAERLLTEAAAAPGLAVGVPQMSVLLTASDKSQETLALYAEKDGTYPARVSGRDVVLLLPAATVADLRSKLAAVRSAKPEKEEAAKPAPETKPGTEVPD